MNIRLDDDKIINQLIRTLIEVNGTIKNSYNAFGVCLLNTHFLGDPLATRNWSLQYTVIYNGIVRLYQHIC